MQRYEVLKDEICVLIGTAEDIREWLEEQVEKKLGFFVMLQENADDDELEIYLHTDNYEDLEEVNLAQLAELKITESNSIEAISQLLEMQISELEVAIAG